MIVPDQKQPLAVKLTPRVLLPSESQLEEKHPELKPPWHSHRWESAGSSAAKPNSSVNNSSSAMVLKIMELCAGSATLCASFKARGVQVIAVDSARNRHSAKVPILVIDLTTEVGQNTIRRIITEGGIAYIHMAPPCGTASRARERPVSAWLQSQGVPSPKPLRSEEFPCGLEGIEGENAVRVAAANAIYAFMVEVICWLKAWGFCGAWRIHADLFFGIFQA